jgi:hypothetical protein
MIAGEQDCFFGNFERGEGRVCRGTSPPNRSMGVLEKKFSEIFGKLGICLARMWPRCSRRSAMRQTRKSPKAPALRRISLPVSHQYGLQIAEGMVTFFKSYERELEKYWTKTLFFQLS